jgi:SAM-dependent methyltransferase
VDALRTVAPQGHVHAVDRHAPFVAAARRRFAAAPGVTVEEADMARVTGPYDFIWCAGAVYFLGVEAALAAWRSVLSPGGAVAFSAPCHFVDAPSAGALDFWEGEGAVGDARDLAAAVARAGYRVLGTRALRAPAWEAYYGPMERRIAALRRDADADLAAVLDAGAREIALWRAHQAETGSLLAVVFPA